MTSLPAILVENSSITTIPVTHPVPSSFLSSPHTDLHGCGCPSVSPPCNPPSAICQFTSSAISTANSVSECQPGPGVIAAWDFSWHKCWHSVGITCNNVCRLHPSRAVIITSRQEIGYSLAWFLGANFTFGAGLFRKIRRERREEKLECTPGNRTAGWPGLGSSMWLEEQWTGNQESWVTLLPVSHIPYNFWSCIWNMHFIRSSDYSETQWSIPLRRRSRPATSLPFHEWGTLIWIEVIMESIGT